MFSLAEADPTNREIAKELQVCLDRSAPGDDTCFYEDPPGASAPLRPLKAKVPGGWGGPAHSQTSESRGACRTRQDVIKWLPKKGSEVFLEDEHTILVDCASVAPPGWYLLLAPILRFRSLRGSRAVFGQAGDLRPIATWAKSQTDGLVEPCFASSGMDAVPTDLLESFGWMLFLTV